MTTQEAYEAIRDYFSQPGRERAIDPESDDCVYKGPKGQKCAVGCLIPDNLYSPEFEGNTLGTLLVLLRDWKDSDAQAAEVYALLNDDESKVSFLTEAQRLHDGQGASDMEEVEEFGPWFVTRLDSLAERHGLHRAA